MQKEKKHMITKRKKAYDNKKEKKHMIRKKYYF